MLDGLDLMLVFMLSNLCSVAFVNHVVCDHDPVSRHRTCHLFEIGFITVLEEEECSVP